MSSAIKIVYKMCKSQENACLCSVFGVSGVGLKWLWVVGCCLYRCSFKNNDIFSVTKSTNPDPFNISHNGFTNFMNGLDFIPASKSFLAAMKTNFILIVRDSH